MDFEFKFLKIAVDGKSLSWNILPQVRIARE